MNRPSLPCGAMDAARLAWSVVARDDETMVFVRLNSTLEVRA